MGITDRDQTRGDRWTVGISAHWRFEPHRAQVLRSDDETRAIAIRLPGGEEPQEHRVHGRTYVLVVDGEVEIAQDGSSVTRGIGFLSPFEPNERRTGARAAMRGSFSCSPRGERV
jgi:hypothetical protein